MPYSLSSYVSHDAATSSSSLDKSSLLTPPLTPLDENETPYKPTDSDRTSLNMKRKRHHHNRDTHEIRHIDSDSGMGLRQLGYIPLVGEVVRRNDLVRSRTFSFARPHDVGSITSQGLVTTIQKKLSEEEANTRSRRWTLPTKSTATLSVTPVRSTIKRAISREGNESPAIITLRRATTNHSAQRTELTFFPEPKFGGQKTGLFSYLVSTLTGSDNSDSRDSGAVVHTNLEGHRSTSSSSHSQHPAMTYPAPTVYTETTVESDLAMPGSSKENSSLRRCSTRYMSGGSTFEVIWDENDTSSSSHRSSEQVVGTENRRPSQAVITLEAQLSRDDTRRSSGCSSSLSSSTSMNSDKVFLDKVLTAEKLRQILPRLFHKSSLRDLPTSKGFQQIKWRISDPTTGDVSHQYMVQDNTRTPIEGMEFFPPLQSRKASVIAPDLVGLEGAGAAASITPPSPRQTRLGSLVGSSSHTRRRSSALPEKLKHGKNETFKDKVRMSSVSIAKFRSSDSDTQPLLGKNPKCKHSRP